MRVSSVSLLSVPLTHPFPPLQSSPLKIINNQAGCVTGEVWQTPPLQRKICQKSIKGIKSIILLIKVDGLDRCICVCSDKLHWLDFSLFQSSYSKIYTISLKQIWISTSGEQHCESIETIYLKCSTEMFKTGPPPHSTFFWGSNSEWVYIYILVAQLNIPYLS